MSLTFGPTALSTPPTDARSVSVTHRDTLEPARLSSEVEVDERGRVSFTVAEPGRYTVTTTNGPTSSSRNVSLEGESAEGTPLTEEELARNDTSETVEDDDSNPESDAEEVTNETAEAEPLVVTEDEAPKPAARKRAPAKKKVEDTES